jgi:hypothetical protein
MLEQPGLDGARDLRRSAPEALRGSSEKVTEQRHDIGAALPQRWDSQRRAAIGFDISSSALRQFAPSQAQVLLASKAVLARIPTGD